MDPILSMIQHSCEPNARPVVEDGKIMVLALKDIPVNGEVTIDYVLDNWLYDYSFRALALSGDRGISCCCSTCEKGKSRIPETEQGDFGLILNKASWHTMNTPVCDTETIQDINWWIARLEQLGYGTGGEYFPFYRRLWKIRLSLRYGEKKYRETLNACLKLYVQIEPAGKVGYEGRIESLYVLCDMVSDLTAHCTPLKTQNSKTNLGN